MDLLHQIEVLRLENERIKSENLELKSEREQLKNDFIQVLQIIGECQQSLVNANIERQTAGLHATDIDEYLVGEGGLNKV